MRIRKTRLEELEKVMEIYRCARDFMAQQGNPNQWGLGHPSKEMIEQDIELGKSYVCVEEEDIAAVFYFAVEEDPTYGRIDGGAWKNQRPYGVIHRIASCHKGAGEFCVRWAMEQCDNIRMDTHKDNIPMQNLLGKCGFFYCGIIYLANGHERLAFHKVGYEKGLAFLSGLDFMKLGQAVNHGQWKSAAMIIQRMRKNAKDAGLPEFDRLFTGISQNINRKNAYEAKQLLALVVNKRVKLLAEMKNIEGHRA